MGQQRGSKARITIDGVEVSVNRASVRWNVPMIPVTSTSGKCGNPDKEAVPDSAAVLPDVPDSPTIEISEACFDPDDSYYLPDPIAILPGAFYEVCYYPAGLDGPCAWGPWNMAAASGEMTLLCPGAQPTMLRFQGDGIPAEELTPFAE